MQSINTDLAAYSDLFMLIAAAVYAVAFILFAMDMATSSRTIRTLEAELAREHAQGAVVGDRNKASVREPVGAGVVINGRQAPAESALRQDRPGAVAPVDGADSTAFGGDRGVDPARVNDELVDEEMDYTGATRRPLANVGVALMIVAVLLHGFAVVARGLAAHRVPWGNMYEFCTTGALLVAAVYLLFLIRKDLRFVGTFVSGLVVVMMCAATMGFPTPVAHLQPALQSPWIVIHVSIAVLASALFTLTFAMSVLQLFQHRREAALQAGQTDRTWPFLRMVPSALSLENWAYRINAVSFVMWTFTVIAGAIWAEAAWGRYWGWDVKEVWSFVIWVVYAGYLHARATRGWTGQRAAWLSIIGYACVIFNFAVVNTLFPGLHSYAGIPE